MTLTKHFNAKSQISRRSTETETETFGGLSLSRYFSAVAAVRKQRIETEVVVVKEVAAPVRVIRLGMNM